MNDQPRVPNEHYLWFGRISAAFAMLDLQLGLLGHAAATGERYTEDWTQVAGRPGQALGLAREATKILPSELAQEVQHLLDDIAELRNERHVLAHSVFVLNPPPAGALPSLVQRSPQGEERPSLNAAEGEALVSALNRATQRAVQLRKRASAARQQELRRTRGPASDGTQSN